MSQLDRAALKAFFETGDKPTQAQFADLIDSVFNLIDNSDSIVYFKKLLILSADVLLLDSNPKDFIPSPGPGKFINIISSQTSVDFNSIPYTDFPSIIFTTETALRYQSYFIDILAATIPSTRIGLIGSPTASIDTQLIPDKKVIIKGVTNNPQSGNSDITCYALYNIIDI